MNASKALGKALFKHLGTSPWWLKAVNVIFRSIRNILKWLYLLKVILVQFTGRAFYVTGLDAEQWMWCVFFGFTELIWGQIVISIPKTILSKKLRCVTSGIPDEVITPTQTESSGKILWLRGLTRLQHQVSQACFSYSKFYKT